MLLRSYSSVLFEHDRIYGLLGKIHTSVNHLLVPDYSLPSQTVFIDLTNTMISVTGDLRIIYCGSRSTDTPSWVVLWQFQADWIALLNFELKVEIPSNDIVFETESCFREDCKLLCYKGLLVDEVDGSTCSVAIANPTGNPDLGFVGSLVQPIRERHAHPDCKSLRTAVKKASFRHTRFPTLTRCLPARCSLVQY